jgi:hypothetical protein
MVYIYIYVLYIHVCVISEMCMYINIYICYMLFILAYQPTNITRAAPSLSSMKVKMKPSGCFSG